MEVVGMLVNFKEVFCPTPEQLQKREERWRKARQEMIDEGNCYYCKHTRSEDRYDHGKYAGDEAYCIIDGRNDYCGLIDQSQRCMFFELREEYKDETV